MSLSDAAGIEPIYPNSYLSLNFNVGILLPYPMSAICEIIIETGSHNCLRYLGLLTGWDDHSQ